VEKNRTYLPASSRRKLLEECSIMKELIDELRSLRLTLTELTETVEEIPAFDDKDDVLATLDGVYNDISELLSLVSGLSE